LEIVKIELDLIEDAPHPLPLGREQPAPVDEPARRPSGDGPDDVEVGQQRLGP